MLFKRCECPATPPCKHPWWYEYEVHGTRYRRSTKTTNKEIARRIEHRRRNRVLEGLPELAIEGLTLKEHIKDYVAHTKEKNVTAYKDQAVLDRLLVIVGDVPLTEVSPFGIERWKQERTKTVERNTVNREMNIVRACFSRAVEWKRIASSPMADVKAYKTDDVRIRVLDDDEIKRVLKMDDTFVALVCRVTLECLPRLSEVLTMQREHIGPSWIEFRRKGGKVTRAAVGDDLRKALLARCHKSGYVFGTGTEGLPLTEQAGTNRVSRALRRIKIKGATHHTMRHTGVTIMLERGVNPRVIQALAGWSSLRMLERYGHARDAEMRRAVEGNAAHLQAVSQ